MRKSASGIVTVRAISGTYVVFLAFDMQKADANALMGFAIQRRDLTEDETCWLREIRPFPASVLRPVLKMPAAMNIHSKHFSGQTTPPNQNTDINTASSQCTANPVP